MASKEGKCSSGGRVNRFVLASVNMTMVDLLVGFVNDDERRDAWDRGGALGSGIDAL